MRVEHISDQHASYVAELFDNIQTTAKLHDSLSKSEVIELYKVAAIEMLADAIWDGENVTKIAEAIEYLHDPMQDLADSTEGIHVSLEASPNAGCYTLADAIENIAEQIN